VEVNHSLKYPNWSQIKNKNVPLSSCNVTACINAAQSAGHDVLALRKNKELRPADDFYEYLLQHEKANKLHKKLDPKGSAPINQWMLCLAVGLSDYLGVKCEFIGAYKLDKMLEWIIQGGTIVTSGRFDKKGGGYIDHIVAIVGSRWYPTYTKDGKIFDYGLSAFIIDDSWGDYRTGYDNKFGDNIIMLFDDIRKFLKELNSPNAKRALLIPRK
jgi:hypothetical protein